MPISFRDATADDAALLAELNHRLIRDEDHRNRMTPHELADRMRGWLSTGEYVAVLFERDGAVAGYVLFRHEPEHVYLRQFYVLPECRRQGVGRAAFEWLRRNCWGGTGRVRLDVLVDNAPARAFWRSVGFAEYCITMERDL